MSIRFLTFLLGIMTPWEPVSPFALQISKNPSIFSFTPPMGWTSPLWFMEPVTAMPWSSGTPERLEKRAYISVQVALSPSISSYSCSKVMVAERVSGNFCAKRSPRKLVNIMRALLCMRPLIFTSLSMFTTPASPMKTLAVILEGFPKGKSPGSRTASPFTWPTTFPPVATMMVSSFI